VINKNGESSISYLHDSNTSTTANATAYGYGNYARAYGTSNSNTYGSDIPITKHRVSLQIKCFHEKPQDGMLPIIDAKKFLDTNFPSQNAPGSLAQKTVANQPK